MRSLVVFALGLTACSVLVEPPDRVRCDPPGALICGTNAICGIEGEDRGYCVDLTCEMGQEICDGLDNDCDGMMDEDLEGRSETCDAVDNDCDGIIDEGLDQDGDGYTSCGTTDCTDPDGSCRLDDTRIDCNDGVANVNPGAPEQCDAIDHDCDGAAVPQGAVGSDLSAPRDVLCSNPAQPWCEPTAGCVPANCFAPRQGAGCSGGQVCNPTTGDCVSVACTPEMCAATGADVFCSPLTGSCELRKGPGQDCDLDDECASRVCAPPEALGIGRAMPGVCVETCCSDNDCAAGLFCWDPGTGSRSCVPVDFEPALHGRATLGSTPAGESCGTSAECRSGLCQSGVCLGPCRDSGDCARGECTLVARNDGTGVLACVPGLRSIGSSCDTDADCAFNACDCFIFCGCSERACATDSGCATGACSYFRNDGGDVWAQCDPFGDSSGACCSNDQCGAGGVCRPQLVSQADGRLWPMFCVSGS